MAKQVKRNHLCSVCSGELGDERWILLNRFAIGTGKARCMSEIESGGEYVWNQDHGGDGSEDDGDAASGHVLHWPECAATYIEAKMIETDFEVRRRFPR